MSLAEIKATLDQVIAGQTLVVIERDFPGEARLHGYAIARSDRLVLVHTFHDFYDEGWVVVRVEDLLEVHVESDKQRFFQRMFRAEDLRPRPPRFAINLWTMQTALKSLHAHARLAIVESETADADEDDFILGQILAVEDDGLTVRPMDAAGEWMDVEQLELAAITQLGVDTPYVKMFEKYGAPPPA